MQAFVGFEYGGQGRPDVISTPEQSHTYENAEEIRDTYEVAQIDSAGAGTGIAVAYGRYSVGSDVFREAVWLIEYDGKWYPDPYGRYRWSSSSERFNDSQMEAISRLRDEVENWEENSATIWE